MNSADAATPPRRNLLLKIRPVLRWVLKLRSSPRAISGGLALGMFIAFTPTVGIQIFLAVFAATMLGLNRPAAIIPVWITNPLTIAPVYTFNYWIGLQFWDGPPLSEVSAMFVEFAKTLTKFHIWDIKDQVLAMLHMGQEILIPLLIGSVAVGLAGALLTYIAAIRLLTLFFKRRAKKRILHSNG